MSIRVLEEHLKYVLNNTDVASDGSIIEKRFLVDRVGSIKIEIYYKEHAPPHFHVKSDEIDASFTVVECKLLKGQIAQREIRKVEYWHEHNRSRLIETWNTSRPTDCPVGKIELSG